jgi:hypothetical protein
VKYLRRRTIVVAAVTVLASAVVVCASVWVGARWFGPERPWNPLGAYPVQLVDVPHGEELPVIRLGDVVPVTGTKCVRDGPVQISGVLSWQAIDPPGGNIQVGTGERVQRTGCVTQTFENPIPPAVVEVIAAQHARGLTDPVWRITGTETPVNGVRTGVPRVWVTDNFVVAP